MGLYVSFDTGGLIEDFFVQFEHNKVASELSFVNNAMLLGETERDRYDCSFICFKWEISFSN